MRAADIMPRLHRPTPDEIGIASGNRQSAPIASVKKTQKGPLRDVLATSMRRLRAKRGLSQLALAHEGGINRTYLSGIERSERNVSIDNIARIAGGLGVEPWMLLKSD